MGKGPELMPPDQYRETLVLYRKRTARQFRLASTSGVRFRYSRQKEAAGTSVPMIMRYSYHRRSRTEVAGEIPGTDGDRVVSPVLVAVIP